MVHAAVHIPLTGSGEGAKCSSVQVATGDVGAARVGGELAAPAPVHVALFGVGERTGG